MTSLLIDHNFVATWSTQYTIGEREQVLLTMVGPEAKSTGYLTKDQLVDIARWKSQRATSRIAANSPGEVEAFTRLAFEAPAYLRHRVLCCLSGVRIPMASAILTVVFPDTYTVYDVRATNTLQAAGYTQTDGYWSYVDLCQGIATKIGTDLRTLDRALWAWDRARSR